MASAFKTAKVSAADPVEVDSIMYVERGLVQGDILKKSTASAWTDFRAGNYASARKKIDALGIVVAVRRAEAPRPLAFGSIRWFSLDGRERKVETSPLFLIQRAGSTQRKP
jgi:hypothetical protein